MDNRIENLFPILFPVAFSAMWGAVTTLLGLLSGWFHLQNLYPSGAEPALLTLRRRSGSMGLGVAMSGILTLSACQSGLRVAISRPFGPFQRPFLIPWEQIDAEPKTMFFVPMTRLRFGRPEEGRLTIEARAWERLTAQAGASAVALRIEPTSNARIGQGLMLQWAAITVIAASFFYGASHLQPGAPAIPLAVCIGFPALAFGVPQIIRYLQSR